MSTHQDMVTLKGLTVTTVALAAGSLISGCAAQRTVVPTDADLFGSEVVAMAAFFTRYRVKALTIHTAPQFPGGANTFWGVKYIAEDASAPPAVLSSILLNGDNSAVQITPSILPACLSLTSSQIDVSGLTWKESDSTSENVGASGELTFVGSGPANTYNVITHYVIEFAGLSTTGLQYGASFMRHALKLRKPKSILRFLGSLGSDQVNNSDSESWEELSAPPENVQVAQPTQVVVARSGKATSNGIRKSVPRK